MQVRLKLVGESTMKYQIGDKVRLKPYDGMQYGYSPDMSKYYNTITTITSGGISFTGNPMYRVSDRNFSWGEDSIELFQKKVYRDKYMYITRLTMDRLVALSDLIPTNYELESGTVKIEVDNSLNSTVSNPIKNGASGEFWVTTSKSKIKLGKILKQLIPTLDSTEIESLVSDWKKKYTVDTSKVCISSDVGEIYDVSDVGGSCMAYKGSYMKIYEDLDCKIAYIEDDGQLLARCIYWDNNITDPNNDICSAYDRIFYRDENSKLTLERYFSDLGVPYIESNHYVSTKQVSDDYPEGVPYIDNMYRVTNSYYLANWSHPNTYTELQSTTGENDYISSFYDEDSVYCEDIEEYRHIDDTFYNQTHDCYYSDDYYLVYVENDGYYHEDDEEIVQTEDAGYQHYDNCWQCEETGYWYFCEDDRIDTACGSTYHIDNIPSNFYLVEDTEEYMDCESEDLVKHEGSIYTLDYYVDNYLQKVGR